MHVQGRRRVRVASSAKDPGVLALHVESFILTGSGEIVKLGLLKMQFV